MVSFSPNRGPDARLAVHCIHAAALRSLGLSLVRGSDHYLDLPFSHVGFALWFHETLHQRVLLLRRASLGRAGRVCLWLLSLADQLPLSIDQRQTIAIVIHTDCKAAVHLDCPAHLRMFHICCMLPYFEVYLLRPVSQIAFGSK